MKIYKQKETIYIKFVFPSAVSTSVTVSVVLKFGDKVICNVPQGDTQTTGVTFVKTDNTHFDMTMLPVFTQNLEPGIYSLELVKYSTDLTSVAITKNKVNFGIEKFTGGPTISTESL